MNIRDTTRRQRRGPEQTIRRNTRIKVMSLITEIHKVGSRRPLVEVDSYKYERSVVVLPIFADVLAVHEAHVRIEHAGRRRRWSARPWPLDSRDSDGPIEVGNGRRLGPWAE